MISIMNKKLPFIILLLLFGCQNPKNESLEEPFSNFMEYGEYAVGFKTIFTTDDSRENVPYSDWSGKLYPQNEVSVGRNLPIHIWYPASEKSKLLPYSYFVNLITTQTEEEWRNSSNSLANEIFIYQANELKGEKSLSLKQLDTLLNLKTNSSLNSKAVHEQFPLVILPNGTSPAYQNVMCEYLASHGYVVAELPLKGEFSHVLDASVKGLETGIDDLQFALGQLLKLPNVNKAQIALLANAIESSFCAGLASRNKKIKALVSLDGGFLSQFEQDILNKTNFYEPQNISIPILAIYAPHPSIFPEQIYHLNYSERYFAHFPEMSEFHFLNFGLFDEYTPDIIGKPKGDVKTGFITASELVLSFLNAKLKGLNSSLDEFYSDNNAKNNEKVIDTLFKLEAFTPPPNMAVLKDLFVKRGIKAIDSIYTSKTLEGNLHPFSQNFYVDFKNWLAWKKDPKYMNRLSLYEMAVESYPNSALNQYRLAYYLDKNNFSKRSQEHYQKARQLLDEDSTLDRSQVADLKNAIAKVLE